MLFDDDYDPCDYCESYGSEYCRYICGNPCYGCSDWDDENLECKSNGGCANGGEKMTDTICDNIKRITKEKALRLGSVEKAAGVSEGYLSRCKAGACQLTVDTAKKFAEVLLVSFDDLLRDQHGWIKKEPHRSKSEVYICPYCCRSCYCRGTECTYRFCPNCGREVRKYA